MVAFRYPVTMSEGPQPDCGPAGTAPMKSESCEVSRGVALNVPGEPLFGMPTQPATEAAAAASTHARQARVSRRHFPARGAPAPRSPWGGRGGRDPALAMRGHPGDLRRGTDTRTQIGRGDLGLVRPERQRRAGEFLPGDPRQGQPEYRALAPLAPGLQPAAVQPCVLERDGQAQAGAAGGAGPRRVRPPEPVEDLLLLAGT